MPDPRSDKDQHRFTQIKARMIDGVAKNLPEHLMHPSGAKDRAEFKKRLVESDAILSIIECCAYEAQCMEEEFARVRHP